MTCAMLRKCLTAAVALTALSAVGALASVSSAEARPADSSFAGTYTWLPGTIYGKTWAVTISNRGQITGSLLSGYGYTKGTLSGKVNDDGSYSFTMSLTAPIYDDEDRGHSGGPKSYTGRTTHTGNMAPDVDGNLVGTPDIGESFTWILQ